MTKRRITKAVIRDGKCVVLGGPSDVPGEKPKQLGIADKIKKLLRKG